MSRFGLSSASPEYHKLREELLQAEIALREQRENVAELRRKLPQDTRVETDYTFLEGPADLAAGDAPQREVRLSELLEDPFKTLVLVHFMYGKKQQQPCPMCTLWADGYDGIVPHLRQRVNFGVIVAGDVAHFRKYARERGWQHLRILSAAESSFKRDLGFEDEEGAQSPGMSVFVRGDDGRVRHFYSGSADLETGGPFRGMDLLSPFWNFLDLTPEGRGDFLPKRSYA